MSDTTVVARTRRGTKRTVRTFAHILDSGVKALKEKHTSPEIPPVIHADLKNSGETQAFHGKKLLEEFWPHQTLYGYPCPFGMVLVAWDAGRKEFYSEFDILSWAFWNDGISHSDLAILMALGTVFSRILNRQKDVHQDAFR